MRRRPPRSTLPYPLVPYTTLFRSLQPHDALEAGQLSVHQFQPAFEAVVVEHGADLGAFQFGVRVTRARELGAQSLERSDVVQPSAQFAAALVHVDAHVRSEEGRGGKEGVSTCRFGWLQSTYKHKVYRAT